MPGVSPRPRHRDCDDGDMGLISLTIEHHRTQEDARRRLEAAVHEASTMFGAMVRRVEWSADRNRVKLEGVGFWLEMWVDAHDVHVTGDVPILAQLLGSPLTSELRRIIEKTFQKQLP